MKTRQRRREHHLGREVEEPIRQSGVVELVAQRLTARSLGDDGRERIGVGCRVDQHLAAHREADRADPVGVDVVARLEVRGRGVQVAVAAPAEDVRISVARALSTAVEEQHPVAVADEHPRLLLGA